MKKLVFSAILIPLFFLLLFSCESQSESIASDTRIALGTVCTISLYEKGTKDIYDELFLRLSEIEQTMSVNIEGSEISIVNSLSGVKKAPISLESYTVLQKALEYANLTDGAFNPAVGPLVKLWSIGTDQAKIPTQEEIEIATRLSDWKNIELFEEDETFFAFLKKKGMSLDLGGIAKGYAADEIIRIIKSYDIESAIIDLGGNIYALGEKENGDYWRVGIKNPFDSTGTPAIRVDLRNNSVVTSGVYERFFEKNGIRYHHLLDSKTGYPANNGLMSVTIVTESSMLADILSTAVFIMGQEKGIAFLESIQEKGFVITSEKEVFPTSSLRSELILLDKSFTLGNNKKLL